MNRVNPDDVAKWFCNQGIIEKPNSKEGNMKVQKLLFFAQLIYMVKNNGETMFNNEFSAFENGVVLEKVMKEYHNDYKKYFDSNEKIPNDIVDVLTLTTEIFGDSSAQELSELSHQFDAWKNYFKRSKNKFGRYNKKLAIIPYNELKKELYKIQEVLDAYKQTQEFPDDGIEDY